MKKQLEENLQHVRKKTISIDELETLLSVRLTYEQFAEIILQLENDTILQMIKSRGRNARKPSLAHSYRINKHALQEDHYKQLQSYRFKYHNLIRLDAYFSLPQTVWEHDKPYLDKINTFIHEYGLPTEYAAAPERSFQLVENEKWIDEEQGKKVLQRIQLWKLMKIIPVIDPLMFAINPNQLTLSNQLHLIVENKTTYHALLPKLTKSNFATLIYGAGMQIEKAIENFHLQYPLPKVNHSFFYFGDIDYAGIAIWHRLYEKIPVKLAKSFYLNCLQKEAVYGKENQLRQEEALQHFVSYFSPSIQQKITETLANKAYFPQEILTTEELQQILLQTDWQQVTLKDGNRNGFN